MHVTPVTDAMSRLCSWAWPSARCCALPACARLPFTHPAKFTQEFMFANTYFQWTVSPNFALFNSNKMSFPQNMSLTAQHFSPLPHP